MSLRRGVISHLGHVFAFFPPVALAALLSLALRTLLLVCLARLLALLARLVDGVEAWLLRAISLRSRRCRLRRRRASRRARLRRWWARSRLRWLGGWRAGGHVPRVGGVINHAQRLLRLLLCERALWRVPYEPAPNALNLGLHCLFIHPLLLRRCHTQLCPALTCMLSQLELTAGFLDENPGISVQANHHRSARSSTTTRKSAAAA